ncbi:hypothetical protein J2T17_007129 [Paenibacillus mucilaginosus]|uniref:hypothetical protein n=1 Tax=Paenibacillus mucilaginosus TaxID=61624 RepID=UPI003D1A37E1
MAQLMFNLTQKYGPWIVTNKGDQDCRELSDRHYSRQTVGARQFTRPGHNLVLRTRDAKALWVTWRGIRDDGFDAFECTIFRNESKHLSSDLIKWALFATVSEWGHDIPKDSFITYVDDTKVASEIPGYCFLRAGWKKIGKSKRRGLFLFQISLERNFLAMQKMQAVKELHEAQRMVNLAMDSGEWYEAEWFRQEAQRLQEYYTSVQELGLASLYEPTIEHDELMNMISPFEGVDDAYFEAGNRLLD